MFELKVTKKEFFEALRNCTLANHFATLSALSQLYFDRMAGSLQAFVNEDPETGAGNPFFDFNQIINDGNTDDYVSMQKLLEVKDVTFAVTVDVPRSVILRFINKHGFQALTHFAKDSEEDEAVSMSDMIRSHVEEDDVKGYALTPIDFDNITTPVYQAIMYEKSRNRVLTTTPEEDPCVSEDDYRRAAELYGRDTLFDPKKTGLACFYLFGLPEDAIFIDKNALFIVGINASEEEFASTFQSYTIIDRLKYTPPGTAKSTNKGVALCHNDLFELSTAINTAFFNTVKPLLDRFHDRSQAGDIDRGNRYPFIFPVSDVTPSIARAVIRNVVGTMVTGEKAYAYKHDTADIACESDAVYSRTANSGAKSLSKKCHGYFTNQENMGGRCIKVMYLMYGGNNFCHSDYYQQRIDPADTRLYNDFYYTDLAADSSAVFTVVAPQLHAPSIFHILAAAHLRIKVDAQIRGGRIVGYRKTSHLNGLVLQNAIFEADDPETPVELEPEEIAEALACLINTLLTVTHGDQITMILPALDRINDDADHGFSEEQVGSIAITRKAIGKIAFSKDPYMPAARLKLSGSVTGFREKMKPIAFFDHADEIDYYEVTFSKR